jgi:aminoglycoside phosphotransferase (APT) family kinase protein
MDAARVTAIVRQQFPQLPLSSVSYLGEGCDNWAFEVDGRWVFRFPKRADVDRQLGVESRMLTVLGRASPIALPQFCFHGEPSAAFPYRFAGYPKLAGERAITLDARAMPVDSWAPALGSFLSWLHRFSVGEAMQLGIEHQDVTAALEEARSDALDDFDVLQLSATADTLARWLPFFQAGPPSAVSALPTVVVHMDLAAEHVLYDPVAQQITGIIDWTEIAIADRAVDLAGIFHWGGPALVRDVLASYDAPVDTGVLERARFLAACRGVGDVAFGRKTGRAEYVEAGFRALRHCLDETPAGEGLK